MISAISLPENQKFSESDKDQVFCFCGAATVGSKYTDQFHREELLLCSCCGTLRIKSIPSVSELEFFYRGMYSRQRQKAISENYFLVMNRRAQAQSRFLSCYLALNGARVLDYGCGHGILLDVLRQKGAVTYGFDYDPFCCEHLVSKGHIQVGADVLERLDEAPWDLICLSHVLEHLPGPEHFLRNLRIRSRFVFLEIPKYDVRLPEQFVDTEGHLWFFTLKGLAAVIKKSGLDVLKCQEAGPAMRLFWSQGALTRRLRDGLRRITGDYFFKQYDRKARSGIWIRSIAKGQ